ncbi:hypothetical protein BDQ17DRAFT_1294958 [Cyathus striatus]|nr:hypothetical protein BDQ17DRAFT_1294958 [Cyathus striatus]
MPGSTFLAIPIEIRLLILHFFLSCHKRVRNQLQPTNAHLRLSYVSSQLRKEALDLAGFKHYISLRHEQQIQSYLNCMETEDLLRVQHIDVANDGRMVLNPVTDQALPVSLLHFILSRLPALKRLRVFDCPRARSLNDFIPNIHVRWDFERSLYPSQFRPQLASYELFVGPMTKVSVLRHMLSADLKRLQLSAGVTGNLLHKNSKQFIEALVSLRAFRYLRGDRLAFEVDDSFLRSLILAVDTHLHTLVLLECSKLSTNTLKECLQDLPRLEYFALSLATYEFSVNFLVALPGLTNVLKLKITNGRYTKPYIREENIVCSYIHDVICCRSPQPRYIYLDLREVIMEYASGMIWRSRACGSTLRIGQWEKDEDV